MHDGDMGIGQENIYDANGNFLRVKVNTTTKNYSYYTGSNKVKNTDGSTNNHYQYDVIGNMNQSTPKNITAISYDKFSNLTKRVTMSGSNSLYLGYDGTKRRVYKKETVNSVNQEQIYLHDGMHAIVERQKSGHTTEYIMGPTGIIAVRTNGTECYIIKDHLGSTRVVVDKTGTVQSGYEYSSFGTLISSTGTNGINYRFTGQEYDGITGLHNFKARMYDEQSGRFYGVDPAEELVYSYGYASNNPLSYRDPDGKFIQFVIMGAMMGGVMGAMQADMQGKNVWEGFGKGFAVGLVGGALGGIANPAAWGGMQSVLVGAGQGVTTNGLSNVLNGKNFFKGAGTAAGMGAAFGLLRTEQFNNAIRGDGWSSNKQLFNEWMAADDDPFKFNAKMKIIDRFGRNTGIYDPGNRYFDPSNFDAVPDARAFTDPSTSLVHYNSTAFESYEQFQYTNFHESGHVIQWNEKRYYEGMIKETPNALEYEAYMLNYRNEGLLGGYNSSLKAHTIKQLENNYPIIINNGVSPTFKSSWWHFVYRIPRVY